MIIGIGNDMESISRVAAVIERRPHFLSTILTPAEIEAANQRSGKHCLEFIAGRFSAKEAYSKALGTGIGKSVSWQDITILNAASGQPIIRVRGQENALSVAITHSGDFVSTIVIIEKRSYLKRLMKKFLEK